MVAQRGTYVYRNLPPEHSIYIARRATRLAAGLDTLSACPRLTRSMTQQLLDPSPNALRIDGRRQLVESETRRPDGRVRCPRNGDKTN